MGLQKMRETENGFILIHERRTMELTKELKEKVLKANSEEEVKALLGDAVKEEEAAAIWRGIEAHKTASGLEMVDDDELDAVSGGVDRDYLNDGCSDTVNGEWCWVNDLCSGTYTTYSNYDPCPKGGNHDWKYTTETIIGKKNPIMKCTKCGEINYKEIFIDIFL